MISTSNKPTETAAVSLEEMTRLVEASPAGPYGFIVSQKVYDELKQRLPSAFQGGNCFNSIPIIIDPDLENGECDVAFTAKGWRERLKKIKDRPALTSRVGINAKEPEETKRT